MKHAAVTTPGLEITRARRIDRAFYAIDAVTLAQRLIGCVLVRDVDGRRISGIIVETEAYLGTKDQASHAFAGRRTQRNQAMYAQAGTAYVYFTYGMHFCMNVVCGQVDEPAAVLLRALHPLEGLEIMQTHRGATAKRARDLCSGPAKLCQAFGIERSFNGLDLVAGTRIWLEAPAPGFVPPRLIRDKRIGISGAGAWAHRLLRWYAADNPHVSVKRKST